MHYYVLMLPLFNSTLINLSSLFNEISWHYRPSGILPGGGLGKPERNGALLRSATAGHNKNIDQNSLRKLFFSLGFIDIPYHPPFKSKCRYHGGATACLNKIEGGEEQALPHHQHHHRTFSRESPSSQSLLHHEASFFVRLVAVMMAMVIQDIMLMPCWIAPRHQYRM